MEKLILNFPPIRFFLFPFLHHHITDGEKNLQFYRKTIARRPRLITGRISKKFLHQLYDCERRLTMSKPLEKAEKNEVIENMLEGLSKMLGTPRSIAFKTSTCVTCGSEAKDLILAKDLIFHQ